MRQQIEVARQGNKTRGSKERNRRGKKRKKIESEER
jgi:hypothetical protein